MKLTGAQRAAVERTGQDVCVVAGPGSGKTRVLIERFASLVEGLVEGLVEARGIDPARILAITFTEKAAMEIKQRLISRFAGRGGEQGDLRGGIERAWVFTIDGFCVRLLRENAIAAGLPPDFTVLDQPSAVRLAHEAADEALDEIFQQQPDALRRLLESLDLSTQEDGRQPDLARSLLAVYDAMRVAGIRELPASLPAASAYAAACELAREALADSTPGNTANQKIAHVGMRKWATEFLALPAAPVTPEHFRRVRLSVNVGHLVKGSAARESAGLLKNDLLPRVEAEFLDIWNGSLLDLLRRALASIDARYRSKKRSAGALDFADLEEDAIRLLESSDAMRREATGRFDEILMDELQDTNRLQWRLISLIRGHLFAVGDINQSIYSFRHAEPEVFENYRAELQSAGAKVDDLRENHRSTGKILEAVSCVLDGEPGIEPRPLISAREASAEVPVERLVGRGEQAIDVEASLVAARVRELTDSKQFCFRDIAILVRTMSAAEPFERALDRFGIPFLVSGGRTFLEAREIRDLTMLLAALVNPLDETSLVGVLRGPLVGMSDQEIFRIGREGWREEFQNRFGRLRTLAGFIPPDLLLAQAVDESGYAASLSDRARANLEKFLAWVRQYARQRHRDRPMPLAELLDDLETLRETQSEAEAPPPDAGNVVRLMSIHAAKGLEFPVVFVSAMHHGPDRRKPVIGFSSAYGVGAKWRNPATGKGQSGAAHAAIVEEIKQREEAEENRLLYVAMTRACDRLILSYADRERPSRWQKLAERVPAMIAAEQLREPPSAITAAAEAIEEQLLEAPVWTGQYDSSAAVSSVAEFYACPRRFVLNLGSSRHGPGSSSIETGLAVHRILAGEDVGSDEQRALAARFKESRLGQRAARADRIEREFDFVLSMEDVVLRGTIDLWFEEAGELIVVDYKTGDESEAHALQLRLYALALKQYAGRLPDRTAIYYLESNREVDVALEPAAAEVRAFLDAQESGEFPLKPGEQCLRCPFFRGRCPSPFRPEPAS